MNDPVDALLARVGSYAGHGINHEDEPFHGELDLAALSDGRGVTLKVRAVGIDGTVYHDERLWIAAAESGELTLWSIHTNGAGVRRHIRRHGAPVSGADATWVFGFGDLGAHRGYRQEIALDLWPDGDISYRVAWGLPGGEHQPRSAVRMRRQAQADA